MALAKSRRRLFFCLVSVVVAAALGASGGLLGVCGPFSDVPADSFCPLVLEIFYLGITTGTTPTTYDPGAGVTRLQMAAFLSRTVDRVGRRGSRRVILDRQWTPQIDTALGTVSVGSPTHLKFDGADVWVSSFFGDSVSRVRASDGRVLETWTGASDAYGVLAANNRIIVTGQSTPGRLYSINPALPAGAVTVVATNLGAGSSGIAFDGIHVFTANTASGSVSVVTPAAAPPWPVSTVTGFSTPLGVLFDGSNVWVADEFAHAILRLDTAGAVIQTVTVAGNPSHPVYDGTNIWVPGQGINAVSVVRASSGTVLQTLTGNGMSLPYTAAFDGERVLVTNNSGTTVSLWKAADLTPLGSFVVGSFPFGATSDGASFWIVAASKVLRF